MPRVVIVDDNDDIRLLLRFALEDQGFEVVGEAVDGRAGLQVTVDAQPDLVILDRDMPVASGIEILPEMREQCPECLIVLYTASADDQVRDAALAAGADQIRAKTDQSMPDMIDDLASLLLATGSAARGGEPSVELRLGPVDADVALAWVHSTTALLAALRAHPAELPDGVDLQLLATFQTFLDEWGAVAAAGGEFRWAAAASPVTVERLLDAWVRIDQLGEDALDRLGVTWSDSYARPFFDQLAAAIVAALDGAGMDRLRSDLPDSWGNG